MKGPGERETTFWQDFTIADKFGKSGIIDTFKRSFKHWKHDIVFITELTIVLNWKCWQHYDNGNMEYSKLYEKLWFEANTWCMDNLKGEERKYFLKKTD